MSEGPKRPIPGYISSYLKQPLRSLAEAERDHEATRSDAEGPELQPGALTQNATGKVPRS
jgi:hypothetical protein